MTATHSLHLSWICHDCHYCYTPSWICHGCHHCCYTPAGSVMTTTHCYTKRSVMTATHCYTPAGSVMTATHSLHPAGSVMTATTLRHPKLDLSWLPLTVTP
ncbi:hypothetical protein Hamer_G026316 [Homarus americanus]|uniref:Uncharacterized protein n=1 Tax=Homarus americanus TaxID=6706 RepID=A0A8J5MK69_HOMAM|nr:hypothetical protein Hamer_G026316 [Homarus americanus]